MSAMHMGAAPAFSENQPLTCLSPSSPQGSDSTRTWALSCLVWYMSICLICSVHLSGPSGPIRVWIPSQIFILVCPGGFQRAYTVQLVNKKLCWVLFSVLSLTPLSLFARRLFFPQHFSHSLPLPLLGRCRWGYPDQVGCVMHLLSPLVPWSRRWEPVSRMIIGFQPFQPNSQALRSSRDDLWAARWQCPSVLCPFALWSSSFCLSAPLLPPPASLPPCFFMLRSPVAFILGFFFVVFTPQLLLFPLFLAQTSVWESIWTEKTNGLEGGRVKALWTGLRT